MLVFIIFLFYCVPAFFLSFGTGQIVMDVTNNAFQATGTLTVVFAVLMFLFYLVRRSLK